MTNILMKWETYGQKLKRCPFSGHRAKIEKTEMLSIDEKYSYTIPVNNYRVLCASSSCNATFVNETMETPEAAAEKWNERTTEKRDVYANYSWNPDWVKWRDRKYKKGKE